ncbi:MAG: response regulator [Gomphosphaeria aponina SAG 52.96 = DSM 107014]|uniref:histidine kinase n=1 Tax=Gomphosphaeria aponina SAG 52.96 = DSM 107014 TaxID=1521640 RepID=A0A941GWE7_9CHRO|nr:response regulator [Gomphosphaeria aponina SAG 52.96 = DSM 107014]
MFKTSLALQHFIQTVPVCSTKTPLEEVLTIFNSGEHQLIVVVNENQSPLGAIYSGSLIPYLLKLQYFYSLDISSLMEPIAILPAAMSVQEFCGQIVAHENKSYAVVCSQGKFLGLLNSWSLLKSLTPETTSDLLLINPLFSIFEQVTLPLMLQNDTGATLYQNQAWREQLGELMPQVWENRANSIKEHLAVQVFSQAIQKKVPVMALSSESLRRVMETTSYTEDLRGENWVKSQFLEPNYQNLTSVCTPQTNLPLTWQFVKLPLNKISSMEKEKSSVWLVVANNVTQDEQCCLEIEAKNANLIQLNQLKDDFLAAIAHELKSPVTSILGLSSLLKEQKLGPLNQRQTRYMELIYRSGRQLMTLVNDILDLTLLETGKLKLNKKLVDIESVCREAYNSIEGDEVEFTLELEPSQIRVLADQQRLRQMLVHLLQVALQFTEPGGKIGLRVNRWATWVAFTVWQTGMGIPEESQQLIFQEFQHSEAQSNGLGLVLTQRLARASGGDVSFVSQLGKGSEFTLLLPWETSYNLNSDTNKLVLIVEAIAGYIENLHGMLRELGYEIVIARTGTEAINKARKLQPELIFLNPCLSQLSGWDVFTLLKGDVTRDIPIIITGDEGDEQKAWEKGAKGFLCLPVEKQALQQIIVEESNKIVMPKLENLTILCLHPEQENIGWVSSTIYAKLDLVLGMQSARILEADDLDQAELLTRVWDIDVVIIDGNLAEPVSYLRSLSEYDSLARKPLVTLDEKTTEAANQIQGLSVFPCLIPAAEQSFEKLLQVIQIAARFGD